MPGIFAIGCGLWFAYTLVTRQKRVTEISGALLATALCYFLGVFLGVAIENAAHSSHVSDAHGMDAHAADAHGAVEGGVAEVHADTHTDEPAGAMSAVTATSSTVTHSTVLEPAARAPGDLLPEQIDQAGGAGLFFSIYYCMTGVHAIHILIGMGVLVWLLVRATKNQFNEQYFGPIDYFGLYWHLVDLIWIYLFPLLYLIR